MIWDVLGTLTLDSDITKPHTVLTNLTLNMHLPDKYLCPITHELMADPVICEGKKIVEKLNNYSSIFKHHFFSGIF